MIGATVVTMLITSVPAREPWIEINITKLNMVEDYVGSREGAVD